MGGRVSIGSSTPKSPRAIMTASVSSKISSNASTAEGFSIFDKIAALPRTIFFASLISSAL